MNLTILLRLSKAVCIKKTCNEIQCMGDAECRFVNGQSQCLCRNNFFNYPNCEFKERKCTKEENYCGTHAQCRKVSLNRINCLCKYGGRHPHCKSGCESKRDCPGITCSHFYCGNLRERCFIANGNPQCECRFGGFIGDCTSLQIRFSRGNQECENDIECQETYNVDFFCYKGRCIIQGCREDRDCPKLGCSRNGYCNTCQNGGLGHRVCSNQNKKCRLVGKSYECEGKCGECPPNKECQKVRNGYKCKCKNGYLTENCENPCESQCTESPLAECVVNSAGHVSCKCKVFSESYPQCSCRRYCGSKESAHCTNNPFEGYCKCNEGYFGSPPNCKKIVSVINVKCRKKCPRGKKCFITNNGQEICGCLNDDCSPFCSNNCGNGKCVITAAGPSCYCENGSLPPRCEEEPHSECDDCYYGTCQVKDHELVCKCKDSTYSPPFCQKKRCKKRCLNGGVCIIQNGREQCICAFEGKYPNCRNNPCDDIFCDNKLSRCVVENSVPKCQCLSGGALERKCEQINPCVNHSCPGFAFCVVIGSQAQCRCRNGGNYPNCKYICNKDCGENAFCYFDPETQKEGCLCRNEQYGYKNGCKPDPCKVAKSVCPRFSECVSFGNHHRCTCKHGYAGVVPFCYPSCEAIVCESYQRCVITNSRAQCICKEPSLVMPSCKPLSCTSIDCGSNAQCFVDNQGYERCHCTDPNKAYPCCSSEKCNPCSVHYCGSFGKCVIAFNGKAKCICKEGGFYPNCNLQPTCDIICNSKGIALMNSAGICRCFCRNKGAQYPDCEKSCSEGCKGGVCNNGQCECSNPNLVYPDCQQGCNDIDCGGRECKMIGNIPTCMCANGQEPPCFNCREKCKRGQECVNGKCLTACDCSSNSVCVRDPITMEPSCICPNGGRPPNCSNCNCNQGEICIYTGKDSYECVCENDIAGKCKKKCRPEDCPFGKCANSGSGSLCVCHNPSYTYPNCQDCPEGQISALDSSESFVCLCKDFTLPKLGRCDVCKENKDCGSNSKCMYESQTDSYVCSCVNPSLMYPKCDSTCNHPYCPCLDVDCSSNKQCVVVRGQPRCICKDKTSCNTCSQDYLDKCERIGGTCEISNGQEICNCGRYGFDTCLPECDPPCRGGTECVIQYGGLPECKCLRGNCNLIIIPPKVCDLCEGICTKNSDGQDECVCIHGGIPPYCRRVPICDLDCGAGTCQINNNGQQECLCIPSGNICDERSFCTLSGKCQCNYGRRGRKCKPFCNTRCRGQAYCRKELTSGNERCFCTYGGKYPNCNQCNIKCPKHKFCAIVHGNPVCVCKNLSRDCDNVNLIDCEKGKSVFHPASKKLICICESGSRNYDKCDGSCSKRRKCKHNEICTEGGNGNANCECRNPNRQFPNCQLRCEDLNCEQSGGICVQTNTGVTECACANGYSNYPHCKEIQCDCPSNADCAIVGGNFYCICKNGKGTFPHCTVCNSQLSQYCNANNGICIVEDSFEKCICADQGSTGIFPNCGNKPIPQIECQAPCDNCFDGICWDKIKCEEKCNGVCVEKENTGRFYCVCLNGANSDSCAITIPILCNELQCENGNCIISNGRAKCECADLQLSPGSCSRCSDTCEENETCDYNGSCVCAYGGKRRCNNFCNKSCLKDAIQAIDRMGNCLCFCKYGGNQYRKDRCRQTPKCRKPCKNDEICVVDTNGNEICLCRNFRANCDQCAKSCPGGKCGHLEGEEICVCPDGSMDYPNCRTKKKVCPGGKSILNREGDPVCVCKFETYNSIDITVYPDCLKPPRGKQQDLEDL